MNPVIGQCPICQDQLQVTQLHCGSCETSINGHFSLGRLHHLTPEQLEFVETFIRCEGKIKRVEQEIGLSYPAVRARLSAIVLAMGYDLDGDDEDDTLVDMNRSEVLSRVASGELTAKEAAKIIRNL